MTLARRIPSGRPADGEFADYAKADIDHVAGEDAVEALEGQARQTLALLTPVDERIASTFTYAPGKWSMKQVLGHMADDERIFAYRALCVARNDPAPLPVSAAAIRRAIMGTAMLAWSLMLSAQQAVAAPEPSVTLPPDLARVLTDYEVAWGSRNAAALAALFAEDGFVLSNGAPPVRGKAAIEKAYTGSGGPLALRAFVFATEGSIGYIIGGFSRQKGQPDLGKFTLTLRKDAGGRWLIMSDMDNGNRPGG
jgi:ketosteroid isomerase-like protein